VAEVKALGKLPGGARSPPVGRTLPRREQHVTTAFLIWQVGRTLPRREQLGAAKGPPLSTAGSADVTAGVVTHLSPHL